MRAEKSLRLLIEKWLSPTLATPIRVMRFNHTRHNVRRYVRVEAQRAEGAVALFFSGTMTDSGTCSHPRRPV
jgi:hypothetical protein